MCSNQVLNPDANSIGIFYFEQLSKRLKTLFKVINKLICFVIVLCFPLCVVNAQKRPTKLLLKDSTVVEGMARFVDYGRGLEFVKSNGKDPIVYTYPEIEKIEMFKNGERVTYEYIQVVNQGTTKLAELLIEGNMNLYKFSYLTEGWVTAGPGLPLGGIGAVSVTLNLSYKKIAVGKDLCVKRSNETMARYFKDQSTGASFKQMGAYYFRDCPSLVERIKSGKYKLNKLGAIVDFYNSFCD